MLSAALPQAVLPPPPIEAPGGGAISLLLDIDGTLIEHKAHPDDAVADEALRRLIASAYAAAGGALAFVTGRSVAMADSMFAPLEVPVAGLYGLEHRLEVGGPIVVADEPADLTLVADEMQRHFQDVEGVHFERKGAVLAVHTRAAPAVFPEVRKSAEQALARLSGRYRILAGNAGLEFVPLEAVKSAAIARLMEQPAFRGRTPFFLGDDTSDEAGFEHVRDVGGVAVLVGRPRPTAAEFQLPDVAAVHRWLSAVVERATSRSGDQRQSGPAGAGEHRKE